jgi:hypothetical protein
MDYVRPAYIEHSTEIVERLNDAERRVGGNGEIDTSVHAFQCGDRGRVLGHIALSGI